MRHARILKSKLVLILMVFCIILLSVLYVFQVNKEVSDRYSIQNYTKKISELSQENKVLEIRLAKAASLDKLVSMAGSMDFERIDKISYIKVLSSQAVVK